MISFKTFLEAYAEDDGGPPKLMEEIALELISRPPFNFEVIKNPVTREGQWGDITITNLARRKILMPQLFGPAGESKPDFFLNRIHQIRQNKYFYSMSRFAGEEKGVSRSTYKFFFTTNHIMEYLSAVQTDLEDIFTPYSLGWYYNEYDKMEEHVRKLKDANVDKNDIDTISGMM